MIHVSTPANQSSMPTTQASGNPGFSQTSPIAATTAAPTSQASRLGQGLRSAWITGPVGSEMPTSSSRSSGSTATGQRSSTSAAITAPRSTMPTTWSPSMTRIGRSDDAKPAISSCTTVSADTSPA